MPLLQAGQTNLNALVVPGLYLQIVSPQNIALNGVPSDILGIVGTATWGPFDTPVVLGDLSDYVAAFGPVAARQYDMGTAVAIAGQNGAANFRCVRRNDGTAVAASAEFLASIILTALYGGSLGNQLQATFGPGSATGTLRFTIVIPGFTAEVYDNIAGSGATLWQNLATAINAGNGALRPQSQFVTAAAASGASAAIPTTATTYAFAAGSGVSSVVAGTDGASGMTDSLMVGSDVNPRTGMYALRSQGCGVAMLADVTTYSTFSLQIAFGLGEGVYMIATDAAGVILSPTGITTAIASKASAGVDSYALKLMFGDWVYWYDQLNQVTRLVSPQAFAAGTLVSLSPEQSSLNKPMTGIVSTQKAGLPNSGQAKAYATADLSAMIQAGFDVIANPCSGGTYFGCQSGHNSSSNAAINGDNYARMTNYLAQTIIGGMGIYVGLPINSGLLLDEAGTLNSFFANMVPAGLLSNDLLGNKPYTVICDATNNPPNRTSLGFTQADCQIRYQAINEKFIVNVEGGVTVQIASSGVTIGASN